MNARPGDLPWVQDIADQLGYILVPKPVEPAIEYAPWETEGGTTAEQNEARFSMR